MRLTQKLFAQHIGFMFKKHWHVQGKRIVRSDGSIEMLAKHGIVVKDAVDLVTKQYPTQEIEIFKKTPIDKTSYVDCFSFGNNNVFVEGLQQAQIISKSIVIDEFPEKVSDAIKNTNISGDTNRNIHRAILTSNALDAYQEKLPKIKVPGKPMYNLPRIYGIPAHRRCQILISKLLFECDKLVSAEKSLPKRVVDDAYFDVFIAKDNNLISLNVKTDTLLLSKDFIKPIKASYQGTIPDLFPMDYTIGLNQLSMPRNEIYPFRNIISKYWPQTLFSHFVPEEVTNLFGSPVTSSQLEGRTLLKAFTVAYSKAKSLYGDKIKDLEQPIVVQAIQTDGKQFHFGIFQLNTMDLNESNETKNIWFQIPKLDLFNDCGYEKGRPTLDGYNSEVFKVLNVFYNNS